MSSVTPHVASTWVAATVKLKQHPQCLCLTAKRMKPALWEYLSEEQASICIWYVNGHLILTVFHVLHKLIAQKHKTWFVCLCG